MTAIAVLFHLDAAGFSLLRLLLTVLWQSTILLAVCGALAFLLRHRKESVRHALWVGALLLLPLLPVLSWTVSTIGAPRREIPVMPVYEPMQDKAYTPLIRPMNGDTQSSAIPPQSVQNAPLRLSPWAAALAVYSGVVLFLLTTILAGRLRVRHWILEGEAVMDDRILAIFDRAREHLGLRREVTVLESDKATVPFAFHTFRPVVLLPSGFAARLTDPELASVAAHELAHIHRHDPLTLTLVSLVRAVFFFQPLVWLAAREAGYLAECACDSAALELTGEARSYAGLISRLAEELPHRTLTPEYAAGLVFSRSVFLKRVEAILSERRKRMKRFTGLALAGTLAAATVSLAAALAFGPGEMKVAQVKKPAAIKAKAAVTASPTVQAVAAVTDTLAAGMVRITGKVVGFDGKPVDGAKVYLYSGRRSLLLPPPVETVAHTAGDGSFSFLFPAERLNAKEWFATLIFSSRRYAILFQSMGGKPNIGRVILGKASEISAVFKDKNGRPIKGAALTVDFIQRQDDAFTVIMDTMDQIPEMAGYSDGKGKAVVSGLPENVIVSVTFSGPGYAAEHRRESILTGEDNIPVVLLPEGRIEGRVTLSNPEKPATGFPVRVYGPENWHPSGYEVLTDRHGRFVISHARPGTYRLYANLKPGALSDYALSSVQDLVVEEGKVVKNVNIGLVRGGIITGRVTKGDTGEPVPEAQVVVEGLAGGYTDRKGVYRLRVVPGKGEVRILMGTPDGYTPITASIPVEIAEGKTLEGVDFKYRKKVGVTMTVMVVSPDGTPVAGAAIRKMIMGKADMETGADGKAIITGLTEGQRTFFEVDKKAADLYGVLQTIVHSGAEMTVQTYKYEIADIEGKVVDEKGVPVSWAKIECHLRSPDDATMNMSLFSFGKIAVSDRAGKYRLKNMVRGASVELSAETEGYEKGELKISELTKDMATLKDIVLKKSPVKSMLDPFLPTLPK